MVCFHFARAIISWKKVTPRWMTKVSAKPGEEGETGCCWDRLIQTEMERTRSQERRQRRTVAEVRMERTRSQERRTVASYPSREEEKGPGTHCLRMLYFPSKHWESGFYWILHSNSLPHFLRVMIRYALLSRSLTFARFNGSSAEALDYAMVPSER